MSDGRWVASETRWFEMTTRYCALCGQVIPSRVWEVDIDEVQQNFCAPACEALYRSYVMREPASAPPVASSAGS